MSAAGEVVHSWKFKGWNDRALSILCLPDSTLAAQLCDRVVLLDIETGRTIWTHPLQTRSFLIPGLHAHPTEPVLAAGTMGEIHWIDSRTGSLVLGQRVRRAILRTMAIAPDGGYLVAGGLIGPIQFWRPAISERTHEVSGLPNMWEASVITSDSRHAFLALHWGDVVKLDTTSWEIERVFPGSEWPLRIKPALGGTLVVVGTGNVSAFGVEDGRERWRCPCSGRAFDVTPDGRTIVTAARGEWIAIDAATGEQQRWPANPAFDMLWSVSISPDGTCIATFDDHRIVVATLPEFQPQALSRA